jgi:hypothetical protein
MSVTCYPTPGKQKALGICEAFARGAGGSVRDPRHGVQPGAAFFYGVVDATARIFETVRNEGRDWYYADNAYFDRGRQSYFRVTKNAFQLSKVVPGDYKRLDRAGVKIKPWRETGEHIVVCEQSAAFMRLCGYKGDWTSDVIAQLKQVTSRPLRVRTWNRDKGKMLATLKRDLIGVRAAPATEFLPAVEEVPGAWALVTHMSAAANEALLAGVPVFVTGPCAALPMSNTDWRHIDNPVLYDGREEWAAGLVANQWTLDEMKSGKCWRDLNE